MEISLSTTVTIITLWWETPTLPATTQFGKLKHFQSVKVQLYATCTCIRTTLWCGSLLTRSLREPGGPCTKSMEVSESRMERVKKEKENIYKSSNDRGILVFKVHVYRRCAE